MICPIPSEWLSTSELLSVSVLNQAGGMRAITDCEAQVAPMLKKLGGWETTGTAGCFPVSPRAVQMCSATLLPQSAVVNGVSFLR